MLLLNILAMGILGLIAWQDLNKKTILWIVFPAGSVVFFIMGILRMEPGEYFINILFNFMFVLVLLTLSTIYYSFKNREPVNVIDRYFGLGDVLFFIILCLAFPPVNFVLFLTCSLLLILLIYPILIVFKYSDRQIPLAGIMAIMLIAVMLTDILSDRINPLSDHSFYLLIEYF